MRRLRLLERMSGLEENRIDLYNLSFENRFENGGEGEESLCKQVSERLERDEKFSKENNNVWTSRYIPERKDTEKSESYFLATYNKHGKSEVFVRHLCKSENGKKQSNTKAGESLESGKSCQYRNDENAESEKSCFGKSGDSDDDESFLSCRSNSECSYYRFHTK